MKVMDIVKLTNKYLAGEQLTFNKLVPFLDATIDDINNKLNSNYPTFSSLEFNELAPIATAEYRFFPDQYIRTVVALGAAYYFYATDEEGEDVASSYRYKYAENLFYMQRDYIEQVPEDFQSVSKGSVVVDLGVGKYIESVDYDIWS